MSNNNKNNTYIALYPIQFYELTALNMYTLFLTNVLRYSIAVSQCNQAVCKETNESKYIYIYNYLCIQFYSQKILIYSFAVSEYNQAVCELHWYHKSIITLQCNQENPLNATFIFVGTMLY